jgi:amino acid adenylation domain-containing protein
MQDSNTNIRFIEVDFDPFGGPPIERLAPTTEPQREIWASCQLGGDDASRAYNESVSLAFSGSVDRQTMASAFTALVQRHESLRLVFSGDGLQICVFEQFPVELTYLDYSGIDSDTQEQYVARYAQQDAVYTFDLLNGPLIKAALLKLSDTAYHFILTAHHIICDGWSLGIILQDLGALYSAYVQQQPAQLPAAPLFTQYATEQVAFTDSSEYQTNVQFWLDRFRDNVPALTLPTDSPRPAIRTYKSTRQDYRLDKTLAQDVRKLGAKAGCSFVTTLMATVEVLLHRLSGQTDIVLGLPASGQSATGYDRLVGHCVNLLPLRSFPKPHDTFTQFLLRRKEALLNAYEHQQLTFGSLLQKLNITRDPSRVPLVPVIFNVDMGLDNDVHFHSLDYRLISNPRQFETVEIFLNIGGSISDLTLEWSFNTQLFEGTTIDRMMQEYESILRAVVANPVIQLDQIPLTDQRQLLQKLARWNNTDADYPRTEPLHVILEKTASQFPDKVALVTKQRNVTYRELNESANQLAHTLGNQGIGVGDIVGVVLDRTPELLISLLAILKAGAAYLPIDPEYPQDRIAFMLSDSGASTVITSRKYQQGLSGSEHASFATQTKTLSVETLLNQSAANPVSAPNVTMSSSDLAYILYTSGSTGRPKGVLIEHRNIVNLLYSMLNFPGMTADDRLLGVTTVSFDIAGLELFLPQLVGATLVLADAETARDGRALLKMLIDQHITIIQATPVTYKMMLAAGWDDTIVPELQESLKILCCGEPMSNDLAQKLTVRCASLWNMYGPTETTIYSTGKQILATDELITIGRPINNTQVYILDEQFNLLPEGIAGEIYLAGDGVAQRGYLNRPELNETKFVLNPFSRVPGERMYRTGDLGKFTTTGEIHCLGRIDHQVKIRGYRIEPGEIEQLLLKQAGVKEVLVLAREDRPGDQRLVAYVVTNPSLTEPAFLNEVVKWRANLTETLPTYMVPADFVRLDQFPVTPNGKIDRNALPKPASARGTQKQFKQPETALEKQIAAIWTDILGLDTLSVQNDFFELGGHSMIAVQVMARLEKETGKRLPLSTLLTYPTIEKLAALLENDKPANRWKSLVPIRPQGTKAPIYIIHGIGLNLLNFSSLVSYMDPDQPIYGLQARGLDGMTEPLDSMEAIAAAYNEELIDQNPTGPYAIAGYSFGGYVALEMARQLKAMGREVKMLAMFDTNAEESLTFRSPMYRLGRKIARQVPKMIWIGKSFLKHPVNTLQYQREFVERQVQQFMQAIGLREEPQPEAGFEQLNRIMEKHEVAYQNYIMQPYDGIIDLFKAKERLYFVEDIKYLGWKKYALKGVRVHDVPGDHQYMLLPPNDREFARTLQRALDAC